MLLATRNAGHFTLNFHEVEIPLREIPKWKIHFERSRKMNVYFDSYSCITLQNALVRYTILSS